VADETFRADGMDCRNLIAVVDSTEMAPLVRHSLGTFRGSSTSTA